MGNKQEKSELPIYECKFNPIGITKIFGKVYMTEG